MENKDIKVLHIDSEKNWRGGQQQAAYLLEAMVAEGFTTAMVCRPGSAFETYCREKNLPHFAVSMHGELDIAAGYRIASLCRKHGFTILHLHSAHALATGLWAKLFCKKLRLIGVRRVFVPVKKNMLSRFKYRTKLVDRMVCISDAVKNQLVEDGVAEDKLVTIYSGVNLEKFQETVNIPEFRKSLGIPEDHVVVGTVAAFTAEKDYQSLINAAAAIIKKQDKVFFCAVGKGSLEEAMAGLACDLGLKDRFLFAGFRPDVGPFLKSFDIFVLASYLEGLGTSILDAQALGLPVVACRTGGVPEIVADEVNGLLVPPKDPEALMTAILDLVQHPDKRQRFGEKAKETVREFSIDKTVEKNIALYRTLV